MMALCCCASLMDGTWIFKRGRICRSQSATRSQWTLGRKLEGRRRSWRDSTRQQWFAEDWKELVKSRSALVRGMDGSLKWGALLKDWIFNSKTYIMEWFVNLRINLNHKNIESLITLMPFLTWNQPKSYKYYESYTDQIQGFLQILWNCESYVFYESREPNKFHQPVSYY